MTVEVVEGPAVYFLGIIDILKEWNFKSRCEYWAKIYILCQSKKGISVQNPDYYSWRFQKKIADEIVQRSGAAEKVHDIVTPVGQTRRESISLGGNQRNLLNMAEMVAQAQAGAGMQAGGTIGNFANNAPGGPMAPGGLSSLAEGGERPSGSNGIFPSDAHMDGQPRMRKGPSSHDAGDIEMGGFKQVPAESPGLTPPNGLPSERKPNLQRRGSEEARVTTAGMSGTGGLFNRSAAPPRPAAQPFTPAKSASSNAAVGSGPLSAAAQNDLFGVPDANGEEQKRAVVSSKKVMTNL